MKSNEAKRNLLRLFVLLCVFFIHIGVVQAVAEDAFVVEEEAVIGGENPQQEPPPVIAPQIKATEPADESEKKPKAAKKAKAEQKAQTGQETEKETETEELSVSENVISQNSVRPPFQTPSRKKETNVLSSKKEVVKKEEKDEAPVSEEVFIKEELIDKETSKERPKAEWWLLGVGTVCFLGGCMRWAFTRKNG